MTAEIAEARPTPVTLAAVRDLLGSGVILVDIASGADMKRKVPRSSPWHYVDVPL